VPDLNHFSLLHLSHNGPPTAANTVLAGRARPSITTPSTQTDFLKDILMARPLFLGMVLAGAASLVGCQAISNDLARTFHPSRHGRGQARADLAARQVTTIGVNAYLWRAALDTLSFAPLAQTDSNGGVITTEWYSNPNNPDERVKVTAAILDRDLRADALRVTAARQTLQNGQWVEAPVAAATVQRLEEIILTRARELRRGSSVN
jgi:hypothetical protein